MDGWMHEWMDGWMDGWMNEWMNKVLIRFGIIVALNVEEHIRLHDPSLDPQ